MDGRWSATGSLNHYEDRAFNNDDSNFTNEQRNQNNLNNMALCDNSFLIVPLNFLENLKLSTSFTLRNT